MSGTFYGLGVGPGDPELITLKAWRLISQVPVIAYPAANGNDSLARSIAAPFIPEDVIELAIDVPMRRERAPAQEAYDAAAQAIASHLDQGRDVAFLCEGDPLFYGSFAYLLTRLAQNYLTQVVPGISSITACAAAINRPLAARNDILKVLPGTLDASRLKQEIISSDAIAIMKVGQHFDKIRGVLSELGLAGQAIIIEKATLDDEKVTRLADVPEGERPYFSTILVYKGGESW
ncbi:precorrin-2 C(20)-methyltransferase [Taklimakanibacter deserti]|uniref:precorrin-2 C(20)-methyltransferase n=1 Tax=Taklimakanibacter deserti TaxID=2267839 RepID=UPI0034D75130